VLCLAPPLLLLTPHPSVPSLVPLPAASPAQLAIFEKVELLHRCYPVYLLGARIIAWMLFEDLDAHAFVMLQQLHWKVDRLRERMVVMSHEGVGPPMSTAAAIASMGSLPAEAKMPNVAADAAVTPQMWQELGKANAAAAPAIRSAGGALGLPSDNEVINRIHQAVKDAAEGKSGAADGGAAAEGAAGATAAAAGDGSVLAGGMAPVAKPPPVAKAAGGGRNVMSLVWFFGVYFFFQWLLGRGS
jgi:hypothetical protein